MLRNVENSDNEYVNEYGQKFIVNKVSTRENTTKKKEINLDDALIDCDEIYDEYYDYDWKDTFSKVKNETELDKNDFFQMDFKESQYYLYKLLVSINTSLLDIKEVLKDERLSR